MARKLILRLVFSALLFLAACLVSSGCRSAGHGSGLAGLSGWGDPVPPQWEPPVETLSSSEIEETSSVE